MDNVLVTKTRTELAAKLAHMATANPAEDTSFALVFVSNALVEAEIKAIKEAVKLCDKVVAIWLPELSRPKKGQKTAVFPSESFQLALHKLGIDIFADLSAEKTAITVQASAQNINATVILQALTTVMPNLVVMPRTHSDLLQVLRELQGTFGELCVLRVT